ncbi:hypothetical protein [Neisseria animalis]|uniref:Ribbon-helix-helix protein, CopG family n=1 Tax=Neisseria animalis TaxID=492 RepID=A0A5P3MR99_NEIAN|nr:hypothetical protein [Neisseria animalis]QEY24126.1 hypothetical protein D0T90_06175 [Neisseria animalis]ROW31516.1 hypothetical protein CGZ60_09955 [Neisseria animalis]VEE06342.1 Uncharacterised protein [Neisseria animalis]
MTAKKYDQVAYNRKSDEKRGVKLCSYKFKLETIAKLEELAAEKGMSKTALLEALIWREAGEQAVLQTAVAE